MSRLLALLFVALGAFAWGFGAARYHVFPYEWLERARALLMGPGDADGAGGGRIATPPGLWGRAPEGTDEAAGPDMERVREMANLGYAEGYVVAPDATGVRFHAAELAQPGVNLVVSGHAAHAALLDMDGHVLHEWAPDAADVWADGSSPPSGHTTFWRRAYAYPNGNLLAIYDGIGMIALDRDSKVLWRNLGGMHHDLEVDERGLIHVLAREERATHDRLELEGPIEEDFVVVLRPDGTEVRRTSVLECFLDSDYAAVVSLAAHAGDILHTNTIELMDGRFADRHPLYAKGNVLVSVPTVNTIAVLDTERETVVWALSGQWQFQHQPTVLDDGHILLFDNLGQNGRSKVIEIDPLTQEIVWSYRDSDERRFSSYFLGSCQRLANGDTLITESAAGRAFEVQPDGSIVWEYVNPHRAGEADELIATLLEVVRLAPERFDADFRAAFRAPAEDGAE